MFEKRQINLKLHDLEFLNKVKSPFAKMNSNFLNKVSSHENLGFVKTAKKDDKDAEAPKGLKFPENFDLKKDMDEHPDHLYVKALAIVADEPNDNGDFFSEDELKKSFHTFVDCPLFVNHKNDDVEEARGVILYAEWSDKDHGIVIIGRVDSKAYPKLARGISEGYISGVSMGTQVGYSKCSVCGNEASKEEEYCTCVKEHKTRMYKGKKVYEINYGLKFIELSFVVDPACSTCYVQEIYDMDDFKEKVASLQNFAGSFKKIASKLSGKAEVEKLNKAESLIQEVAKIMLDQKDKLELTYVTDLVEALSKLQQTKDELVDMGYESLESTPSPATPAAETPPSTPTESTENLNAEKGQNLEQQNIEYQNVGATPAGEVGSVTMPGAIANTFKKNLVKKSSSNNLSSIFKSNLMKKLNQK